MSRQERILELVKSVSKNWRPVESEESLFEAGVLDSFALADLVGSLEQEFGVTVPDADLTPRKFESLAKIDSYLETHGG